MYKDNGYNSYRYNSSVEPESPYKEIGQDSSHPAGSTGKRTSHKKLRHEHRKMGAFMKSLCCALIIGGVSGGMVLGSFAVGSQIGGKGNTAAVTTTSSALNTVSNDTKATTSDGSTYTVAQIAEKCTSSVVAITNKSVSDTRNLFGQMYENETESAGSGVIINKSDSEILIVTNYHVIEGSKTLTVCFNDSKDSVYEASVKGTDESNDLAVIAVSIKDMDEDVLNNITIASVGDSTKSIVGEQVVAIGNALGYGQSVTSGYISALDKEVAIDESNSATLIQTDAAINPGNSGGALFNMNGELIGINTAKYAETSVEGMGFAIPMSTAKDIIEDLMQGTSKEKMSSGYGSLGIYGQDVDSEVASTYEMPQGVYIAQVLEDSAAGNAGMQKGDIITKLDKKSISSMSALKDALQYFKAGEKVSVTYARNNNGTFEEKTVEVTLGKASEDSSASGSNGNGQNGSGSQGGQNGQGGMNGYGNQGGQDGMQGYGNQGGQSGMQGYGNQGGQDSMQGYGNQGGQDSMQGYGSQDGMSSIEDFFNNFLN